jgi:hypothetical protein
VDFDCLHSGLGYRPLAHFTRSFSASPFDASGDPPFGGSCQARDCTTSMREKPTGTCTDEIDEIMDPAKTNLWR